MPWRKLPPALQLYTHRVSHAAPVWCCERNHTFLPVFQVYHDLASDPSSAPLVHKHSNLVCDKFGICIGYIIKFGVRVSYSHQFGIRARVLDKLRHLRALAPKSQAHSHRGIHRNVILDSVFFALCVGL